MPTPPHLFASPEALSGAQDEFQLTGSGALHAIRVLRMRPGEEIVLLNGQGQLVRCQITLVKRDTLVMRCLQRVCVEDDRLPIYLVIALLRPEKMDVVIQKATELGVQEIWPVFTAHCGCLSPFAPAHLQARYERWQEIARQALKQCRGGFLPKIRPIMSLEEACAAIDVDFKVHTRLFCWEGATSSSHLLWPTITPPCILTLGPEGGFSKAEYRMLMERNFLPISLGRRILRAETAAISAISITNYLISRNKNND